MKYENKIVNTVIALEVAIMFWIGIVGFFGNNSGFLQYVRWKVESVPRIGLLQTGITRDEMLLRFGQADYMQIYYDKAYKTDVTKFYYRVDEDDTLFLMFVYSWKTGKIIDFDMVRGYRNWYFWSHGSSLLSTPPVS